MWSLRHVRPSPASTSPRSSASSWLAGRKIKQWWRTSPVTRAKTDQHDDVRLTCNGWEKFAGPNERIKHGGDCRLILDLDDDPGR